MYWNNTHLQQRLSTDKNFTMRAWISLCTTVVRTTQHGTEQFILFIYLLGDCL